MFTPPRMNHPNNMNNINNSNRGHGGRQSGRAAVLGQGPRAIPPAWRHQPPPKPYNPSMGAGSKIFIAGLPLDVERDQIQELMHTTVGALRDTFCVYNKAGKTTGMAIVHFVKPGDAHKARMLYHNKIIDQRAPIHVDLIVDTTQGFGLPITQPPPPPPPRTLLDRIQPAGRVPRGGKHIPPQSRGHPNAAMNIQQQRASAVQAQANQAPAQPHVMPSRQKRKKGPRRLQKNNVDPAASSKKQPRTAKDLDKDMDEYNAGADKDGVPMKS
ncbi:hypothetical protein FRB94_011470 [Tulasnella sp. JGI-2019a]|nr:hypothetical protein FRB93_013215 [Tulasnella sp. JGI-2019a]KAG9009777.1 hypothetical protein FRB94_011470 [Tulasnella sp. JGI-2019a]KAG9034593.1 hypothetical protein FRB95_013046 [Tulasnella sp. JGI-2019a]